MKFLEQTKNLNENFVQGMNMSGRLEPAFYVEEPNYKILRSNEEALQSIGGLFLICWSKFSFLSKRTRLFKVKILNWLTEL